MLFTRCPDCETTFRVTDETLKKANGQVRCGRCASVFNAYAELQDSAAKSVEATPPSPAVTPRTSEPVAAPRAPEATVPPVVATTARAAATPPSAVAPPAEDFGQRPVAEVVGEVAVAETESSGKAEPDLDLITAKQVDEVLASPITTPPASEPRSWTAFGTEPAAKAPSRWWGVAAAFSLLALGAQVVHYFRADVAAHATFGPWIQQAYALVGVELAPHWDVRQYQILDWVAMAEPNSRGLGSLKIAARIKNNGPMRQPYPAVQLRLKDRWEKAVSSRLFTPAEYLPRDTPRGLMSPGETTRAEIEVVDPGPDAYGFELDVCIEVEASLVTCGTDKVFL
jgi:predicted Zn finger-like uncharacterized protein